MKKDTAISNETLYFRIPVYIGDYLIYCLGFYLMINSPLGALDWTSTITREVPYLLMAVAYLISVAWHGINGANRMATGLQTIWRAIDQAFWTSAFFFALIAVLYHVSPSVLCLAIFGFAAFGLSIFHATAISLLRLARKNGRNTRSVLMIGADENLVAIYRKMMEGYGIHGYRVAGFFTDKYQELIPQGAQNLGHMDKALEWLQNNHVDEVYCAVNPASDQQLVNSLIHQCETEFIQFWFVPNMNGYPRRRMTHSEFGSVTVMKLRDEPLDNPVMKFWKRTVDILFSGLFLITLYPLVWTFAAIGIKLSSPGPILFRQKRTGYNGKAFDCLKFRSMKVNADADTLQATEHDPRKTKFGDFLRKTSIDELPQFINVFKGDMSIVGPRPHMEHHTEIYSELISDYMVRHLLKPGITGWAQVNGCRGETKTLDEMKNRVEHDIWYIEHWSPSLDIKIIFMTIWQILGGDKQAY